jgi:hypothetical protein
MPFSPEPFITHLIAWINNVLSTIHLYDQPFLQIGKIYHISANALLPTKLETFHLSIFQMPP